MSDDLLRRAAEPSRLRLREITHRVPARIHPLVETLALRFLDPAYNVTRIRREAGATDWDVRIFGSELGTAPGELRLALRVEVANRLLRDSSLSLEKIAHLVGYRSLRSLERLFSEECGYSPSDGRSYLRRVASEYRALGDELRGWYFRVRLHRGELEEADFDRVAAYLRRRFDPS